MSVRDNLIAAKHTKGPWRVREVVKLHSDGSTTLEAYEILARRRVIVTDVCEEADARVIAAAPEMFEALCLVQSSTAWSHLSEYTQEVVTAAIASASLNGEKE